MSVAPSDRPAEAPRRVPRSRLWYGFSRFLVLVFARSWLRLRVENAGRLPAEGSVLLVANHSSYLDPPLIGAASRRPIAFLAQAGLGRFPPLRLWLRKVGVTLIDRSAPSTAALRLVADSLKAGEVVGIYPEGTRSADGRIGPFKSGVEFLARRTGTVIVPVGIDGSFRAMSRWARWPRPRKVVVRFGEPRPATQVLAPGGVDALRREVAMLARAELVEAPAETLAGGLSGSGPGAGLVDPAASAAARGSSAAAAGGTASESAGGGA